MNSELEYFPHGLVGNLRFVKEHAVLYEVDLVFFISVESRVDGASSRYVD